MSGVAVVRALLVADSGLTAVVPSSRIAAGIIPQGSNVPCIALTDVSGVDRNILKPGAKKRVTERVQVTVIAQNYVQQKLLIGYIRRIRDYIGNIGGVTEVTVHTDGKGPDFSDPDAGFYMQTQDFLVSFNEAA